MDCPTILGRHPSRTVGRRPRRGLLPAVRPLEGRRLLTASAVMTQTATFPDLETLPTVSNQALLYFGATMGTLTEVDVVTSGSFQSQFSAENLAPTSRTIEGTTAGNLAIDVPTGAIPVSIPSVTESFDASAFDGKRDYGGTSGQTMAPVTSSSTPQTTVLTSPADLAAFTGFARIPIGVSGHATGSTTPDDSEVSAAFNTDTSATITVIYHYIPNPSGPVQPPASPISSVGGGSNAAPGTTSSAGGGSNLAPVAATGTTTDQGSGGASSALTGASTTDVQHHGHSKSRVVPNHKAHPSHRVNPTQPDVALPHPRRLIRIANHKG